MTCEDARESLSAYLDEALAPAERSVVDTHLEGCAACRRELAALRGTVALLQRAEPARAPVGFVDRAVAAARPRPWYRRVAAAVFLPISIKLPLEVTAVVMVGLLAVYLFERTPGLQQTAREVAPHQEPTSPAKEKPVDRFADRAPSSPAPGQAPARAAGERVDAPGSQEVNPQITASPPAVGAPASPAEPAPPAASPPPPQAKPGAKTEASPGENVAGAVRPEAESRQKTLQPSADSTRAAPPAPRLAAKRAAPPADVVARVAVKDRDAAERELAALIARVGGSVTQRRREDEATVVEAVIPHPRYAEFSESLARIGTWRVDAERPDLPTQIHVILRLQ